MPEYRRVFFKGETYFITIVTCHRVPLFKNPEARKYLHNAFVDVKSRFPFNLDAICLLHASLRKPISKILGRVHRGMNHGKGKTKRRYGKGVIGSILLGTSMI